MDLAEISTIEPRKVRRIPRIPQYQNYASLLFEAADLNDLKQFQHLLDLPDYTSAVDILHNGSYGLLQYLCILPNRHAFVDELLKHDASPNATGPKYSTPPIHLAAEYGNQLALKTLLNHEKTDVGVVDFQSKRESVLHKVVLMQHAQIENNGASMNYLECLDALLCLLDETEGNDDRGLHVNVQDDYGNTPLHIAASKLSSGGELNQEMVVRLLRAGSSVGIQNKDGEPAFKRIPAELLESFMNECITTNKKAPFEKDFMITFCYKFLVPSTLGRETLTKQVNQYVEEDPLLQLSASEDHKRLLKHPVLASCIYLMWFRIRWIFVVNFLIYAVFVIMLTFYILDIIDGGHNKGERGQFYFFCLRPAFFLYCIREFIHILMSMGKYMKVPVNRPKIILIILSSYLVWYDVNIYVATITILMMWTHLAILLGQHPRLITYIIMFRTVSVNFFFFIAVYSMFFVAFAFSFFILFHNSNSETVPIYEYDYFKNPWRALIKTALMMLGEFEMSNIPFNFCPGLSYAVFSGFLLLISMVLINLLNGLAVSDTHSIMERAELVGYVSQVQVFSQLETMMLDVARLVNLFICFGACKQLLHKFGPYNQCEKAIHLKLCDWTHVFWKWKKMDVLVNQGGLIQQCFCFLGYPKFMRRTMDEKVVQRAVKIALDKRKVRTVDDVWKRLERIENLVKRVLESTTELNKVRDREIRSEI